jgi:hypothetical protein
LTTGQPTRKERREQARKERMEREAAELARRQRQRRMWQVGGGIVLVAAIAIAAIVIATSGGGSKGVSNNNGGSGVNAGLQSGPAPWAPEYGHLIERVQALNLPAASDQVYHIHAMLRLYVNGKQMQVPQGIGIDPSGQFLASLHTHDATGTIHMEADQPYPFTLGQLFTVWGVKFTQTQLGGYSAGNGNVVAVYANGKQVPSGPAYQMKPHDAIVVAYGKPGSFPTSYKPNFPAGL